MTGGDMCSYIIYNYNTSALANKQTIVSNSNNNDIINNNYNNGNNTNKPYHDSYNKYYQQ